jgi:hypothetical protein
MDLTDFPPEGSVLTASNGSQEDVASDETMNAVEALKYIDEHWYKKFVGKNTRWMDLIGDYAGNERFILDGKVVVCLWRLFFWGLQPSRGVVVAACSR